MIFLKWDDADESTLQAIKYLEIKKKKIIAWPVLLSG